MHKIEQGESKALSQPRVRTAADDLYAALVAAGIPTDSHESDLYCLSTPESRALVELSGKSFNRFTSQVDGKAWLDVPFTFTPFWDKVRARIAPLTAQQEAK
jgi:hypothetical protein